MTEQTHFIINSLSINYQIEVNKLSLLPIGADMNASIYKVEASDQKTYFVKVKKDHVHDANITTLELLQTEGIQQLILPIKTMGGRLSHQTEDFTLIVYPFIQGQDGFSCSLSDEQWITLGRALRQVHEIHVPPSLQIRIRQEDFSPKWRDIVRSLFVNSEAVCANDEIALNLWKFLQENKSLILKIVDHSEQLCQKICTNSLKFVLCHSDIHGGNILVADKKSFYIVDWDDPILAPKEHDLMFIGGGVGNVWNKPHEENLFYQGYGQVDVDGALLAYYRFERIVKDIADYCQALLSQSTEDKEKKYKEFLSIFEPHGVVDIAFATAKHIVNKITQSPFCKTYKNIYP